MLSGQTGFRHKPSATPWTAASFRRIVSLVACAQDDWPMETITPPAEVGLPAGTYLCALNPCHGVGAS